MTEVKYDIGGGKEIIAEYDESGFMEITRECFEALIEKQIPQKVKRKDIREYAIFYCPNNHFIFEEHCKFFDLNKHDFSKCGYCECCGQKLDWSDEDDRAD